MLDQKNGHEADVEEEDVIHTALGEFGKIYLRGRNGEEYRKRTQKEKDPTIIDDTPINSEEVIRSVRMKLSKIFPQNNVLDKIKKKALESVIFSEKQSEYSDSPSKKLSSCCN